MAEVPTCPKCGKELTVLEAFAKEESKYEVYYNRGGTLGYDYQECVEGSTQHTDFCCPYCHAVLFTSDDTTQPQDVIDFLREE